MEFKTVLFDLDGVLIDTEGVYSRFWSDIDREYPTGIADFASVIKGSTLASILNTYFDKADHAAIVARLTDLEQNMDYQLFAGVEDLLGRLRRAGKKTAIVTSSNRAKMRRLFDRLPVLEQLTDGLVTDEDVSASKPDPEGYLKGAAMFDTPAGQFIVCEDSYAGLEAGRRAGAYVVGIATTNPRTEVEKRAHVTLDTITGFADAVEF